MKIQYDLQLKLRDFTLDIQGAWDTGTLGIYGPSGAGKSTFFNLLQGLLKPDQGLIRLNNRELTRVDRGIYIPVQHRKIALVFQNKLLFPHMNIRENLQFPLAYVKSPRIEFNEVVDLLELSELLDSMPQDISGGEQQRTAIGRALLSSPELLLLDEPFNGVDITLREKILQYLKTLSTELKIPMMVISHELSDLEALTKDILYMKRGKFLKTKAHRFSIPGCYPI
ncbi:MAG: ATP-binding cassette domain-containing protein [Spirochaetaceae bacterium]|nr:ATP-binding cassette domain-containing protein [Spirochaetaceae bacterium]